MGEFPCILPLAVDATEAARLCGVSRATWWRMNSAGKIPAPVRVTRRSPRWLVDELRGWLIAGCPDRQTWHRIWKGGAA